MSLSRLQNNQGIGHNDGYWPGYVDALVNVVLNLMFLAAVLAVGSISLEMDSARKVLLDQKAKEDRASFMADHKPKQVAQPVSHDRREQLVLHFVDYAVRLDDSARERLKSELKREMSQGVQYWKVSIDLDVNDNLQRRAAYLRMMSVRSAFLEAGIEPIRFNLLMHAGDVASVGQQILQIVPERQLPEGKLPSAAHEGGGTDMFFPKSDVQENQR